MDQVKYLSISKREKAYHTKMCVCVCFFINFSEATTKREGGSHIYTYIDVQCKFAIYPIPKLDG
jgi:hypothetical protein